MGPLLLLFAASLAPADGKMAVDDWQQLSISGVGTDAGGASHIRVQGGDLDGDGRADIADIRLTCDGNMLAASEVSVLSPRDASSGLATGKRTHDPVRLVKEWGKPTPQLSKVRPQYDVKKVEGSRLSLVEGNWAPITLGQAEGLCDAARRATKTRSNIQNN